MAGSSSPTTSCGHPLLRPELAPIPESCAAELALHEKLIATPRARRGARASSTSIADADARENYGIWLRFRDRIAAAPSLEAAYVTLFRRRRRRAAAPRASADRDPAAAHPRRRRGSDRGARRRNAVPHAEDRRDSRRRRHGRRLATRSSCWPRPAASEAWASSCSRTARRCARSISTRSTPATRRTTGTATSGTTSRSA